MEKTGSGIGIATIAGSGTMLDVWYPAPNLGPLNKSAKIKSALESLAVPDRSWSHEKSY